MDAGTRNYEATGVTALPMIHHQLLGSVGGLESAELVPSGSLDIESTDHFRQAFTQMLGTGVSQFFVDLRGVGYVDSTGLGSLMQLFRDTKSRNGKTWFYGLNPPVAEIFSLTHLDRIVELYETREGVFAKAEEQNR